MPISRLTNSSENIYSLDKFRFRAADTQSLINETYSRSHHKATLPHLHNTLILLCIALVSVPPHLLTQLNILPRPCVHKTHISLVYSDSGVMVEPRPNNDQNNKMAAHVAFPSKPGSGSASQTDVKERFYRYFQQECTQLQEQIERLGEYSLVGGEKQDAIDHVLSGISRLANDVKDSSEYITAYDQRTYSQVRHFHSYSYLVQPNNDRPLKHLRRN